MTLGITPATPDLFRSTRELCEPRLAATSVYRLLADQGHALFADEAFGDLFDDVGRRSVPPRIVATVMVLQRIAGASEVLDAARNRQRDPRWRERYRATRPKVERKIAHLMRRKHGGRRARMRGKLRVGHDFALLAAAINLARLATLAVRVPSPSGACEGPTAHAG